MFTASSRGGSGRFEKPEGPVFSWRSALDLRASTAIARAFAQQEIKQELVVQDLVRKVGGDDRAFLLQDDQPLHQVLELADVSRPAIGHQMLQRLRVDPVDRRLLAVIAAG